MKYVLAFICGVGLATCVVAQDAPKSDFVYQSSGVVTTAASGHMGGSPLKGAPYSATITNESVEALADGNRIVQSSTGTTARDSQGRTRQDAPLPAIGNLSAENAPHIVFIMDPVAQVSYSLNLTDKTAQKLSVPPPPPPGSPSGGGPATTTRMFIARPAGAALSDAPPAPPPMAIAMAKVGGEDHADATTEDLGSQTMEGLLVTGVRTTRTIPAGEIGNEKPITSVTEVWTSPDLKVIVYSKRTDPRMGEQTYKLTNIVRAEPDASLFTIPADFKVTEGAQNFIYRTNP
jgi:hypothetical protein